MESEKWEKLRRLKREFTVDMAELFLNANFDIYSRSYTYIIKGYSLLGSGGICPKDLWLDVDGTLEAYNTDGVSKRHFDALAELNQRINKRKDLIFSFLNAITNFARRTGRFLLKGIKRYFLEDQVSVIDPRNAYHSFERNVIDLSKELREAGLKKRDHEEAARIAVDKVKLVNNLEPALKKLEVDMGYKIELASSGPDAAIKNLARKIQIPTVRAKASEFKFNEKGEFLELDPYSGIRKIFDKKNYHVCTFVTDDYEADAYAISSLFDLGLIVVPTEKMVEIPGRIYIRIPEMRRDFLKLPEIVRRYEWALLYSWRHSPLVIYEGVETIREINRYASLCKSSLEEPEIYHYGQQVKEKTEALFNLLGPVLPHPDKMRDLLDELKIEEAAGNTKSYKKIIEDIMSRVNKTPLAKAKEGFGKKYKEEWEDLGMREEGWLYG